MRSALVVPSCRESCFREFLSAWGGGDWDAVVLVEDGPTKTFRVPSYVQHFAWDDVDRILGDDTWIVSRRDSAIRCFGFYLAHRGGYDLIATLDDDCFPRGDGFVAAHARAMGGHARWVESIPGMRTRGLPYKDRGALGGVMANMGLWSNVPDLDAIQTLSGVPAAGFDPPRGSRIIPRGQYFPMCGMNLAFRREAAPLFYFPLMGENSPYRRFDDIWAGVIAKRVMDHLGWSFSVGDPAVEHRRASDPMVNLVKEAPGIAANESFWAAVDSARLSATTAADCVAELGEGLASHPDPYVARLGAALGVWASLFTD